MMWFGYGAGWMWIPMALFWLAVFATIVWAVGTSARREARLGESLLAERYARGEIDEEEFERRRQVLAGS